MTDVSKSNLDDLKREVGRIARGGGSFRISPRRRTTALSHQHRLTVGCARPVGLRHQPIAAHSAAGCCARTSAAVRSANWRPARSAIRVFRRTVTRKRCARGSGWRWRTAICGKRSTTLNSIGRATEVTAAVLRLGEAWRRRQSPTSQHERVNKCFRVVRLGANRRSAVCRRRKEGD